MPTAPTVLIHYPGRALVFVILQQHHKPSKTYDKYRANLALVSRRLAIRQHHLDLMGTEEYSFTLSSTQTSEQVSKAVTHFTSPRYASATQRRRASGFCFERFSSLPLPDTSGQAASLFKVFLTCSARVPVFELLYWHVALCTFHSRKKKTASKDEFRYTDMHLSRFICLFFWTAGVGHIYFFSFDIYLSIIFFLEI